MQVEVKDLWDKKNMLENILLLDWSCNYQKYRTSDIKPHSASDILDSRVEREKLLHQYLHYNHLEQPLYVAED